MSLVVTGLSQNGDMSVLRAALITAGLPTDSLVVVGPDESTPSLSRGLIGSELLTREGGTSVPGLTGSSRDREFFRNESLPDRLGDFEIPDTEIGNYVDALHRGKSVVAYFAHVDTIDRVEAVFRESELLNVRRF
jgi:hypothetical protein